MDNQWPNRPLWRGFGTRGPMEKGPECDNDTHVLWSARWGRAQKVDQTNFKIARAKWREDYPAEVLVWDARPRPAAPVKDPRRGASCVPCPPLSDTETAALHAEWDAQTVFWAQKRQAEKDTAKKKEAGKKKKRKRKAFVWSKWLASISVYFV